MIVISLLEKCLIQISMNNIFIASSLANDPHTEGMHNAAKIAESAGIKSLVLKPSETYDSLFEAIREYHPRYIGLSYRLTPKIGFEQLRYVLRQFLDTGLLSRNDDVRISFAGLPETIAMVKANQAYLPLKIYLCEPYPDIMDRVTETVDFFEVRENRSAIIERIREEVCPKGIGLLDQLADEVIVQDDYKNEPPLRIPSVEATKSFVTRISESDIPLLRSHFGIPDKTIEPTVDGIRKLAEARVVDEISLGSSDLSQRYYGHPEEFEGRKNDGGVPYKTKEDLRRLFLASRCGNYPAVKPYCHVVDIVPFIHDCLDVGMLTGAHQAIPLFWFNELDGRGPHTVRESVHEHFAAVRELASLGIPVEMNDPNQWSSRLAHDTIIVASYALISAVMTVCGVDNMVLQMQFNKPKETGDYADLAKMSAGLYMAERLAGARAIPPKIIIEARTGIESLSPDMRKAKWQLGRSTLLQMMMNPSVLHIVSYCEANHAATADDIIDSSKLVRHAVRIFRKHQHDIMRYMSDDIIKERREYLINECTYLLTEIAKLNKNFHAAAQLNQLTRYLADPDVLSSAIEKKIMSAPGIINLKYKGEFTTAPTKYGMINLVDDYLSKNIVSEKQRIICVE